MWFVAEPVVTLPPNFPWWMESFIYSMKCMDKCTELWDVGRILGAVIQGGGWCIGGLRHHSVIAWELHIFNEFLGWDPRGLMDSGVSVEELPEDWLHGNDD